MTIGIRSTLARAVAVAVLTWSSSVAAQSDELGPSEELLPNESLTSANGRYTFIYQNDGNLVLYRNSDGVPLWASNTAGTSPGVAIMQRDGNLVIYDANDDYVWESGTSRNRRSRLLVQNDGNVVIYRRDGTPSWSTDTWVTTGPLGSGDGLAPGETLIPNTELTSANGRYTFTYQSDGNLVLYGPAGALWASNTNGRTAGVAIMQDDGNLVVYGPRNEVQWSSDTWGNPGSRLVVQDDGNVVIYRPDGVAIWSTDTWITTGPVGSGDRLNPGQTLIPGTQIGSPNGRYRLIYQTDGNLVLYGPRRALWASDTNGRFPGVAIMQTDGNLVIYGLRNEVIWSSGTWGNPDSFLIVQDDGNLVIYRPDGTPIWATDTWQ